MDNAPVHCKQDVKRVLESYMERKNKTILSIDKAEELLQTRTIGWGRRAMSRRIILQETIRNASDVVTVEQCAY
ncbi:hypothetical protein QTN25_007824 [Entamoeba marina]